MSLLADFHNHSCLSPCGSLEMSPQTIARLAAGKGIGLLGLSDHNSALNCPAFSTACAREGVIPLYGIEATSAEEVHLLCLFPFLESVLAFGEELYRLLPSIPNDPQKMGDQVWVDEEDFIGGEVEFWLGSALSCGIDELGPLVASFGGLCIPAHVDRPAFSMTSQLGFIADGPWAALECVHLPPKVPTGAWPLVTSSDAHYPEHLGRRPFSLDIEREALLDSGIGSAKPPSTGGDTALTLLCQALSKRPRTY